MKKFNFYFFCLLSMYSQLSAMETSKPDQAWDKKKSDAQSTVSDMVNIKDFLYRQPVGEEHRIAMLALRSAPAAVKACMLQEENNTIEKNDIALRINWLLLLGRLGTGKTTLAKALACRLNKACYFITPADLLQTYQNGAGLYLKDILSAIVRKAVREKTVVVIDNIDVMTSNYTSAQSVLCSIMEKIKYERNFYLIATASDPDKLPQELQGKFLPTCIKLSMPTQEGLKRILTFYLGHTETYNHIKVKVDENVHGYISSLTNQIIMWTPHEIKSFFCIAQQYALESDQEPTVTIECIEKAMQRMKDNKKLFSNSELEKDQEIKQQKELILFKIEQEELATRRRLDAERAAQVQAEQSKIKLEKELIQMRMEAEKEWLELKAQILGK